MRLMVAGLLALALVALPAHAQKRRAAVPDPTRDKLLLRAGFLNAHPDLQYRLLGLQSMKKARHAEAFRYFQRAAYYADKPSQGMVAEMLWDGRGAAQDRPLAYAWMDLAAERGYVGFLGLRERYWNALDEAGRRRAVEAGQSVYAKYGDAAAKPRIATVLRRGRARMTGSRVGSPGFLQIVLPGPGGYPGDGGITSVADFGGYVIDGSKFYDPLYWDPEKYQAWHDSMWSSPRIGRVRVGELQNADAAATRVPEVPADVDAPPPEVPDEEAIPPD